MRVGVLMGTFAISLAAACGSEDPPSMRLPSGPPGAPSSGTGGASGRGPTKDGGSLPVGQYTEQLVEDDPAPLPIAGGTLAIIAQGTKAAVADPDRDQVVVIDLASLQIAKVIPLAPGDDPGRLVEDAVGHLHVALRAGRGVAVLDPVSGEKLERFPVCPLPRGLAYEYVSDRVHVACAGGELVSYTASNGEVVRKWRLDRDLRDVVVDGERLLVSRFRAAELLVVESDGKISARLVPPNGSTNGSPEAGASIMKPAVAWRTVPAPGGGALMVHQLMALGPIGTEGGGYGSRCRRILTTAVSSFHLSRSGWMVDAIPTVLSVDVAVTGDGSRIAVPGAARSPAADFNGSLPYAVFNAPSGARQSLAPCGGAFPMPPFVDGAPVPAGRVVAVAFDPAGRLALQTREPAQFHLGSRMVSLPGRSRKHTGHELFHLATVGGIACASCHPEGLEDGQVWTFAKIGPRRTQSLGGGILGTEPFHWAGDMTDFNMLAVDVFSQRMSGPIVEPVHRTSLMNWVNTIPSREPPAATDPTAVERGQALFNDSTVGCATCHSGPRMTNNLTTSVNTGGPFQVPSLLGLAWRAPYMHSGCAATLQERFAYCGGGDAHGTTSQLTAAQQSDLVAYMETL
jgi:mono/diheme cytochrome c family protein